VETSSQHSNDHPLEPSAPISHARRLIADQRYFGMEAFALRTGLGRALARLAAQPADEARIDARGLAEDFQIDAAASATLLTTLLTGGLLYPDGAGRYQPTRAFRDHALARIVAPLTRERAKSLLDKSCRLAVRINAEWDHIPYRIETIAVSGSYMSCRDQLSELSLSLVLSRRHDAQVAKPRLGKDAARGKLVDALSALSSFMVVRIVADRNAAQRPFSVVFQAAEHVAETESEPEPRDRIRDWSASLGRWLAFR